MGFDLENIRNWFYSVSNETPIWTLYRGASPAVRWAIRKYEGPRDEAWQELEEEIKRQSELSNIKTICIKVLQKAKDGNPKQITVDRKYGTLRGGGQHDYQNPMYHQSYIDRVSGLQESRLQEQLNSMSILHTKQMEWIDKENSYKQKIRDLESKLESATANSVTMWEKIIDRCNPIIDAVGNAIAHNISQPAPHIARIDTQESQVTKAKQGGMLDYNSALLSITRLKKIDPNIEQLLEKLSLYAWQNPQGYQIYRQQIDSVIDANTSNSNTSTQ